MFEGPLSQIDGERETVELRRVFRRVINHQGILFRDQLGRGTKFLGGSLTWWVGPYYRTLGIGNWIDLYFEVRLTFL